MARPSWGLATFAAFLLLTSTLVIYRAGDMQRLSAVDLVKLQGLVVWLGATDLAISTEARYTRHLTVSDSVAVSMDHPGAFDHFPSSVFFVPIH